MSDLSCARAMLEDVHHCAYLQQGNLHIVVLSHPEQRQQEPTGYYVLATQGEQSPSLLTLKAIHKNYDTLCMYLTDARLPIDEGWQPGQSASQPELVERIINGSFTLFQLHQRIA